MEKMRVVAQFQDIENNISTLEKLKNSSSLSDVEAYRKLIKRGTCFVPYQQNRKISFAPSRFIGYEGNSIDRHAQSQEKDGRITNEAISSIFGMRPQQHPHLEKLYFDFCSRVGVEPSKTGTFGAPRKYWSTVEIRNLLESIELANIEKDLSLTETEREQISKARVGQGLFRKRLIALWKNRCAVSDCALLRILKASHIKPWRDSTNSERLDKYNGVLLNPNIDALFDEGYISFLNNGKILISPHVDASSIAILLHGSKDKVRFSPEHFPYLEHHRLHVFKGK
ncbi:putative restriction endonuclease [Paraburkholderia atlantica]|uniref:HNH endonuclease n=1 Tax=Paraburkholderia atlantica TaxID=2654982 RepID=UPI003D19EF31